MNGPEATPTGPLLTFFDAAACTFMDVVLAHPDEYTPGAQITIISEDKTVEIELVIHRKQPEKLAA